VDQKPKRKYTVSAKVLAACRRNLEKANAVPNSIRYRPTSRRLAASRANLLVAHARRASQAGSAEFPAVGNSAACLPRPGHSVSRLTGPGDGSLRAAVCHWGQEAKEQFWARCEKQLGTADACQKKVVRAIAACATRWLALLDHRLQREQKMLLSSLLTHHKSLVASRLVGLFTSPGQLDPSLARLELRIKRLGRMLFELRHFPSPPLRAALEEIPAQALGNPLRPMPSSAMAALLQQPAPALIAPENADGAGQGGELLPAEAPWSVEEQLHFLERHDRAKSSAPSPDPLQPEQPASGASRCAGREDGVSNPPPRSQPAAFPADFAEFHTLVKDALSFQKIPDAKLDATIEHIARLIWERQDLAAREWKRAQEAVQSALSGLSGIAELDPQTTESVSDDSAPRPPDTDLAQRVLDAFIGEATQRARIQTIELERQLLEAIGCYFDLSPSRDPAARPKPACGQEPFGGRRTAATWEDWEQSLNLR
jgi:hypothetical protein